MFKSDSTRVACLWIPRFPIVVAQRPGNAPSQPAALIQGEGSHACLVHVNEAAHRQGIREGWRLSRARALSPHGRWIPWDEVVDQRLMEVTQRLSEALSQVAPRLDASGHGCFWLEPFIPRGEPDLASGEEAFATGIADRLVAEGELLETALSTASAIAENPVPQLLMTKQLLTQNGSATDLKQIQRDESKLLRECWETPEHAEAVDAFLSKRKPVFRGLRSGS